MPRISVPDGPQHITSRVYALQPGYSAAHEAMLDAVFRHSILPARLREAVRYKMALINGCQLCLAARASDAEAEGMTEDCYGAIADGHPESVLSEREVLAIDYAERFAVDHHSMDDEYFNAVHANFTDAEVLDLTFYAGRFLMFGRLTHVLGLDDTCPVVGSPDDRESALI
jgi:AhpD family alkylhydroperoxidase